MAGCADVSCAMTEQRQLGGIHNERRPCAVRLHRAFVGAQSDRQDAAFAQYAVRAHLPEDGRWAGPFRHQQNRNAKDPFRFFAGKRRRRYQTFISRIPTKAVLKMVWMRQINDIRFEP